MEERKILKKKKKLLPGGGISYYKFKKPTFEILQTFPAPVKSIISSSKISFESTEISALCPLTGQPDWYKVIITYIPKDKCIESKSAKLYFGAYREFPGFIETICEMIYSDWLKACSPEYLLVVLRMAPRGGISIEVEKEFK